MDDEERRIDFVDAQKNMQHSDFLIIGGGVIGLMSARELARAGACVRVVEAGECGREASWAGGGIVSPLYPWRYLAPITALASWSQAHYADLCAALLADTGIDAQFRQSGLLMLSVHDRDDAVSWAQQSQKSIQQIAPDEIESVQTGLATASETALFFPEVAQVRNPRLMKALQADCLQRGVDIIEHSPVRAFVPEKNSPRISVVQCASPQAQAVSVFSADKIMVCAGAWSARLLAGVLTPEQLPAVKPIRGQMLMFAAHQHDLKRIVLAAGRYLIPRADGRILCGSTVEDVGFDKTTTASAQAQLHAAAIAMMPSLQAVSIEQHWAGLRPGSSNGIPFIGALPTLENVFINAGHFRNGVVLAPAAARLGVDLLLARTPIVAPAAYGCVR